MEVLVGFGVTSSAEASSAFVRESAAAADAQGNGQGASGTPLSRRMIFPKRNGYQDEEDDDETAESDGSSSSIGVPDDSDDNEDEDLDEVSSKDERKGFGSLGSLAALEDSLPVKRGLSNHFSGKSKSFTNLSEAVATTSAKDIEKTEHPFNKKRRILRWSKNMMLPTAMSMPLLPVVSEEEDDDGDATRHDGNEDDEDDRDRSDGERKIPTPRSVFKSYSCFALSDLREEAEEEDEE